MIELLIVFGGVLGLALAGMLGVWVPVDTLLGAGGVVTGVGLLIGVPTGFWYHVALYRALRPHGPLPARWWLHPVPLHGRLDAAQRPQVLRWFVAGGLGFGVVVLGCGLVVTGLLAAVAGG